MQWNKDVIARILEYLLPKLSFLQIELFLFQKIKVFRRKAIYELLRRCEWSEESSEYLINLLSFHLSQKSLLSLQIPRPLLEKCLLYSFINPKLAILIHGCLGYLDRQLPKSSQCFVNVVSHLTLEGLPYIYLACVSANPASVTEVFKTCLGLADEKIKLQSLLLISNYLNGVERRRLVDLLTTVRFIEIQSRVIFNIALSIINDNTVLALLNELVSANYVIYSSRRNECGIGYKSDPPRLIFAASLWRRLQPNNKKLIIERLISMLYQPNLLSLALAEFSALSDIMEKEYCAKLFDEISNYNLFFPIKLHGTGRSANISIDFFRKMLPNIWGHLDTDQHERGINLVLYFIQTDFFHKKEYVQDSLKCFFDVLSDQYISELFIRLIKLVQEYNIENVSTNFDDIMLGVSYALNLLQYRLKIADVGFLNKILTNWLSASFKHKILASWILNNVFDIFQEEDQAILVDLLMKNLESEDQDVFIFSTICLQDVRGELLNSCSARRCIDIFTKNYNKMNPQYSLQVILNNFRELFLKLDLNDRTSYVTDLLNSYTTYSYSRTNVHIILSIILDFIDSKHLDKIEKNILFELNKDYRHSGFSAQDGFNELLERISYLKSVRDAVIAIYNKSSDNIKYLPEGFRQGIYRWLPIQKTQSKLEKIVMNKEGKSCQYLRANNEFRFFSSKWSEMKNKFQSDTICYVRKRVGKIPDYGDLAVVMMLWPKISESEKEAMEDALTKRYPTKRITNTQ